MQFDCYRDGVVAHAALLPRQVQTNYGWPADKSCSVPAAYAWTIKRNKVIDHTRTHWPPLIEDAAFDTATLRDAIDPIGQITESLTLFRALRQLTNRQSGPCPWSEVPRSSADWN
ncbi:hypothetical protein AB0G97_22985 [Streptomyces sp. NPDC020755]|uniref:hypothetical protein n=1 Tax=unclassified Streptomyces TaxID=2593676 RepID=UPI0022423C1D|nr:hypothetical protein [Streptomyces sp. VB1]UZI33403.1 hypothetical protein OH133_37915 [Streptomyces sp. VB1]